MTGLAFLVVTGLVAAPSAVAAPRTGLHVVASPALPAGSTLTAITTAGENRAWVVGRQPTADGNNSPIAEQWDGRQWRLVPLPTLPPIDNRPIIDAALTSVSATPQGDVWAAGWQRANLGRYRPLVLHRVGATWTVLPLPDGLAKPQSYLLAAIAAVDSQHVWVAGSSIYHHPQMFLESWDGTKWTGHDLPLPGGFFGSLAALNAVNANDVWATGEAAHAVSDPIRGEVATYHWNGTAWSLVPMPTSPSSPHGVLGSGDTLAAAGGHDVWLSGSNFTDPSNFATLERWNGSAWTIGPDLPAATAINQLAVDAHHNAWAAGTRTTTATVLRWNGHRWHEVGLPSSVTGAATSAMGIATTPSGCTTWAFADTPSPVILRSS